MKQGKTLQAAFAVLTLGSASAFGQAAPATPPASEEQVYTLSPFVVREAQAVGYKAANSVTASRFALPIIDTPMSIQVVTEDFMKDIGSRDALESLSYVSGITQGASPVRLEGSNAFNIRGVQTGFILRDGVTSYGINDSYNIERYEVLKGIVGMMYGDRNLGGVINAVSRKPKDTFGGEVLVRTDTWDSWRVQGNFGGPLNESKTLAYVISAFAKDEGTFMDYERLRARGVTGVLNWQPFKGTSITGEIETYTQDNTLATKLPPLQIARGPRFANDTVWWQRIGYAPVAKEFNYGGPNAYLREHNKLYAFTIDQKITDWLNFRSYGNYAVRDQRRFNRDAAASFTTMGASTPRSYVDFATGTVRTETEASAPYIVNFLNSNLREFQNWNFIWRNDLVANYELWKTSNRTMVGFETQERSSENYVFDSYSAVTLDSRNPFAATQLGLDGRGRVNFDIRTFDPSLPMPTREEIVARAINDPSDQFGNFNGGTNETQAAYIVHYSQFLDDRAIVFAGLRQDRDRSKSYYERRLGGVQSGRRTPNAPKWYNPSLPNNWRVTNSPQVGLSYKIRRDLSVYATWSDVLVGYNSDSNTYLDELVFNSTTNTWSVGPKKAQPATMGENMELGFKSELFDGRLSGTLAFFHTKLKNKSVDVGTSNPGNVTYNPTTNTGTIGYRAVIGEETYKGVELDVVYNVNDQWSTLFSYAFLDASVTKDPLIRRDDSDPAPGNQFAFTPTFLGQRTPNVPEHQFKLWNNYRFAADQGLLKDARVGLGIRYLGDSIAIYDNGRNQINPAYVVVDLSLSKTFKFSGHAINATLRVNNLLDEDYLGTRQIYGEPRNFVLEARYRF